MKTMFKAALAATVATGLFASPALAANTAGPESFKATATIMKPLTLVNVDDLEFGTILMGALLTSSDVVVDASIGAVAVCGAELSCSNLSKPASFDVTGVAFQNLDVNVTMPADAGKLMDVDGNSVDFVLDAPTSISLDDAGARRFYIGGAITVTAGTVDGVYSNDVNVTVEYI